MFSYNSASGQTAAAVPGFYHAPSSGFHLHHQYSLQNGQSTAAPTAFTNIIQRGYQQQDGVGRYQPPVESIKTNEEEEDMQSVDSHSDSRTPTQSDQQLTGPLQTRKRRRGVIEKRRRDRINNSLIELRRLVPAALEKQGSQKLEKAEILQMTVDHLRFLNSKGFDSLWRDQQRYATEYYSMGFRFCVNEVENFLSKEGMDIQDPLRLRLMSHLQSVSVQRQSAFNVWTNSHQQVQPHPSGQYQSPYWPPMGAAMSPATSAASGLQYGAYSRPVMIPGQSDVVYSSQPTQAMSSSAGQPTLQDGVDAFKNGFVTTAPAQTGSGNFVNGNMAFSSAASSMNSSNGGTY